MKNHDPVEALVWALITTGAVWSLTWGEYGHWVPLALALAVIGWIAKAVGR